VLKLLTVLALVVDHTEELQFDLIVVYTVLVSVLSMVLKLRLCVINLHMLITLVLERRKQAALLLQNNSGIHWLGWHVESVLTWWQ
jgi:Flp pilus assembly protein protease CpaA